MSAAPKTVFLHVGCRKSGTSALQLGLREAERELEASGLEQPLGSRGGIMSGLVDPLRAAIVDGHDEAARRAVEELASTIRASPRPRHLISLEALAELPEQATALVVGGLAEFDVRLVVTARPWAFTVPSEWQQLVKSRFTTDYGTYARAVHEPGSASAEMAEEAEKFRRRQDVADVVRRWRVAEPGIPVDVVLVPHDRSARPDLVEMFCRVVGIDHELLPVSERVINPSISHEDAEVLRLLNIALGDRLANTRGNYRHSVRKWIARRVMMSGSHGSRIRLPQEMEEWATAETVRQVAELKAMGCTLHGDPDLFAHPELPEDDFEPATPEQVADAAVSALAELAVLHDAERREAAQREREERRRAARRARAARRRAAQRADRAREEQREVADRGLPRRALASVRRRVVSRRRSR